MARNYSDTDCPLNGTPYCERLNMRDCAHCTVRERAAKDPDSVKNDLDAVEELIPEGGIAPLFTSDECMFCRGEAHGAREWYALTDLGNAKTASEKEGPLGIKLGARTGFVLPVQISCCDACRKRLLTLEYLPLGIGLAIAILSIAVFSVRSIREALMAVTTSLPALVVIAALALGVAVGFLVEGRLAKRYAKVMHVDAFEIDVMGALRQNGWFALYKGRHIPVKLIFSRKPLECGVYTSADADNAAQDDK